MQLKMENRLERGAPAQSVAQVERDHLVFRLGGDKCAVPFFKVVALLRLESQADFVLPMRGNRNIVDFYGVPVPFIDLRKSYAGDLAADEEQLPAIVVFSWANEWVAVGVDAIEGVCYMDPEHVTPASEIQGLTKANYLLGIGLAENEVHLLLDIDRFIADSNIAAGMAMAA